MQLTELNPPPGDKKVSGLSGLDLFVAVPVELVTSQAFLGGPVRKGRAFEFEPAVLSVGREGAKERMLEMVKRVR